MPECAAVEDIILQGDGEGKEQKCSSGVLGVLGMAGFPKGDGTSFNSVNLPGIFPLVSSSGLLSTAMLHR